MALNLKALHILVIEDIQPLRELTISVLKAQGFGTVSFATDGVRGFEAFCRGNPDIILTDWNMPEMNGTDMVKKIRQSPRSPNKMIPIVMMTGFGSMDKISHARDCGVNEFLIKPFSATDLSKRLTHLIKAPRDFIIHENFVGPDRRRRQANGIANDSRSPTPPPNVKIIKPNNLLQAKAGLGSIDEQSILRSQSILDNNRINFAPLAAKFLNELKEIIENARKTGASNHRVIEDLTLPIMQIKANARIFKYDLLGDLASVMMNFLDNLKTLDRVALDIVAAHHITLHHIVQHEMQGHGGDIGINFQTELENVCKRYMNSRAEELKGRLKNIQNEAQISA